MTSFAHSVQAWACRWKTLVPGPVREALRRTVLLGLHALDARRFYVGGRAYRYFFHDYNKAWTCERTVEVPIAVHYLQQYAGKRVLEVGNVLAHYQPTQHEVVDKYEVAPGVLNLDVVDVSPEPRYDLIISISTLEHVGWDEPVKEAGKIPAAITRLTGCLRPGGLLLVTLPLNYNTYLDQHLRDGTIKFDQVHYLRRVSALNAWREVDRPTAEGGLYGTPYTSANGLVIGLIRR